jgi:hypothetical protein
VRLKVFIAEVPFLHGELLVEAEKSGTTSMGIGLSFDAVIRT